MCKSLITTIAIFLLPFYCAAQNEKPCKISKNIGGKYRLINAERSEVQGKKTFFLQIKVKSQNINNEYLLKVARRLRETYCRETNLVASIIDNNYDGVKFDDLLPTPIFPLGTRAIYGLDRFTGKESIQFISKDEKVTNELVIQEAK